jgi:hypothetical protein
VTGVAFLDRLRALGFTLRTRGLRLIAPASLPADTDRFAAVQRHRESLRLALNGDVRELLDDLTTDERAALGFEPLWLGVGSYRRKVWVHQRGDAYGSAVLMGDVPLDAIVADADALAAWRKAAVPPRVADPEVRPGRLPGSFVITRRRDRAYRPVSLA